MGVYLRLAQHTGLCICTSYCMLQVITSSKKLNHTDFCYLIGFDYSGRILWAWDRGELISDPFVQLNTIVLRGN